ncbi:MAG TPA: chromate transporter [Ruminococcaceae bacterium]|nr:chromate transporter [Oscillospiraceae bacterium]
MSKQTNEKKSFDAKDLLRLFMSFFKIGAFTFGGGYAMLPMLERELVEERKWVKSEDLLDYFAVGQCTPGVIAVNTATLVGYKRGKVLGAVVATLGVVCPSVIIITVIAALLQNYADIPAVRHAFVGIRIAVCALITAAVIKLAKSNVKSLVQILLAVLAFVVVAILGASPVWVVIGASVAGLVLGKFGKKPKEEENK